MVPVAVAWIVDPILSLVLNINGHGSIARFLASSASSAMASPATSAGQGFEVSLLPVVGRRAGDAGYAAVLGGAGAAATLQRDVS